jgi:hypothetical protein
MHNLLCRKLHFLFIREKLKHKTKNSFNRGSDFCERTFAESAMFGTNSFFPVAHDDKLLFDPFFLVL